MNGSSNFQWVRAYARWSDNDRNFGPFTYSRDRDGYRPFEVALVTGNDERPFGNTLRLRGFGHTFLVRLPTIVQPYREKVIAESWDAATIARLGRNWYWDIDRREYGVSLNDGFLNVRYGRQSGDSSTEQRRGYFLPWQDWRHIRTSLYGLNGEHFWTDWSRPRNFKFRDDWRTRERIVQAVPKARFEIADSDGKRITATTHVEELEHRFGTKWCRWLSLFRRPRISRSLSMSFAQEVGPDKGSWKGGLVGTGIEIALGESHESAFRRWCNQEHRAKHGRFRVTFIGPVSEPNTAAADKDASQP